MTNWNDERRTRNWTSVAGPNVSSAIATAAAIASLFLLAGCRSEPKPPASSPPPAATPASAAAPTVPIRPGAVPIDLTATIHGIEYQLKGSGDCAFAGEAAIYDVPATMWHAALRSDRSAVSYVNLTIWQFKNGAPNQFSLGLEATGEFRHIATIKGATIVGAGTARVERSGEAAMLAVEGTDARGASVQLSLRCAGVTAASEEGGR